MSSVASQIILHPTASQSLRLLSTTLGRDKIYRAAQYFARFLAWFLISKGYNVEAARWNALKNHLGSGRKLLRLGKPLEHLQAALRAAQSLSHPAEQLTTIGRQLGYAGYLIYDAAVWANSIRFINLSPEKAGKYTKASFRLWLAGILFSIGNGVLKASRLATESRKLRQVQAAEKNIGEETERQVKLAAIDKDLATVKHQFVTDLLDVWIPATNLGYAHLNDGFLGMFGLITSLLALNKQWASVGAKKAN